MPKQTSRTKSSPGKVARTSSPRTFKAGDRVKVTGGKLWLDELGTVDSVDEGLVNVCLDVNRAAGQDAKAAVREFTVDELSHDAAR